MDNLYYRRVQGLFCQLCQQDYDYFEFATRKFNQLIWYISQSRYIDSISRDERGFPLTQYINVGISRAGYTITHLKHHHRVLRLISSRMKSTKVQTLGGIWWKYWNIWIETTFACIRIIVLGIYRTSFQHNLHCFINDVYM